MASLRSVASITAVFGALTLPAGAQTPDPRPNVILIVLDDVGVDRLGFYGDCAPCPPTPNLDSLRQQGVLFRSAYANPLCSPSRAALMTGRHAFRTGIGKNTDGMSTLELVESTLPELLKAGFPGQAPYACGAFGKWHLSIQQGQTSLDLRHPIDQGFDTFVGAMGNPLPPMHHFYWDRVRADSSGNAGHEMIGSLNQPFDENVYIASVVRSASSQWIAEQEGPFFAYVCFTSPEKSFQVPPLALLSSATRQDIIDARLRMGDPASPHRAYGWWLEAVDTEIGLLLSSIDPETLAHTTILVVGDNGPPQDSVVGGLADHAKETVYQLGTHVPLIVKGYGVQQPGGTCRGLVGITDFWRTIAEITGGQINLSGGEDSLSFRHLLLDPLAASQRTQALVQRFKENGPYVPDPGNQAPKEAHDRGMTDGRYKYIRKWDDQTMTEEAYDLQADPEESNDLLPNWPTLPPEAQAAIEELRRSMVELSGK